MSNDHENSQSTVAAIGVAILLALIILAVPAGFGFFHFARQQAQYQRVLAAERQALAQAEMARAQAAVTGDEKTQVETDPSTVTFDVNKDGTISRGSVTFQDFAPSADDASTVELIVDPECTAESLGKIVKSYLDVGVQVIIKKKINKREE